MREAHHVNGEITIRPRNSTVLSLGDVIDALTSVGYEITWTGETNFEINEDGPIQAYPCGETESRLIAALVLSVGKAQEDH